MQVYKAFFKIIWKNIGQIMMYIFIFIGLAVLLTSTNNSSINTDFTESRVNIAFFNYDTNSKLIEGLKEYLAKKGDFINVPDERQRLQDALFYREVEYIVRVPDGFTESFLSGDTPVIEKTTIPGTARGHYLDNLINNYLNTAESYLNNIDDLSKEELIASINQDMSQTTEVVLNNSIEKTSNSVDYPYYFNFMAYTLYAVLIFGVSSVMMVFNESDLKKRNLCSPVKLKNISLQLILGNFTYALLVWLILIFISFVIYGDYMFTASGLLLILNSLIFTLAVLSISYLIGNVVKSRPAMTTINNVFALGTSFISGVFVPQELLGNKLLKIASFTPNYWYIKSNNYIVKLTDYSIKDLKPIFFNMLIVIGFTLAVLSITLVIIKQKRISN
ncbi:MAG: ABC transporter permease [Halothermotrichaceae bacterium]